MPGHRGGDEASRWRDGQRCESGDTSPALKNYLAYIKDELDRKAMLDAAGRGAEVLVVEPIARRIVPWWDGWARRFEQQGGRADTWRFRTVLPERLRLLDKAAGLDHGELTARTLYLARN